MIERYRFTLDPEEKINVRHAVPPLTFGGRETVSPGFVLHLDATARTGRRRVRHSILIYSPLLLGIRHRRRQGDADFARAAVPHRAVRRIDDEADDSADQDVA
jgi:hypothetical protein